MTKTLLECLGFDHTAMELGQAPGLPKEMPGGPIEPWMREFVKEKHSEEEWNCFFRYAKASTFQRVMMLIGGVFFGASLFNKGKS